MKQLYKLPIVLSLLFTVTISSQNIQYDLRCSGDGSSYEIYVSRDANTSFPFALGSSTITLILPTGSSRTIAFTSESVATYSQQPAIIDGNSSGNDFYPFTSSGGAQTTLTADTPVLWLTLTPSDGTNQDARLFINGTDPSDLGGVNASNTFTTISASGIVNEYSSNVSDVVVNCSSLSTDDFDKISNELSIYPNPFTDTLLIESNVDIENVEIYDVKGKRVFNNNNGKREISVGHLQKGLYLMKVYYQGGIKTKRVIKK
ncbi:T9SS type A sorting domain-containing protein [Winogradskyella haliclonae]|uniref:Secretion system C-terminal sorting domain-containing protein n=1 Tax=Winogradskyella haliclonae TaxID=2048558 RepID=A0ABQ2BXE4_9FLAO|nr:T9SS type A sorting domain-containing protein [Winogradskyella haliclonae]GGI56413.1 hypothetical protein GCM10011444_07220 [Winogradskyella haliclonae]